MVEQSLKFAKTISAKQGCHNEDAANKKSWNILVVDDDQSVHDVTYLILSNFSFDNKPVKLTFAYSAKEARELLEQPNDYSVLLLDVVMETEHAGLDLVSHIRNVINNQFLRIILRTGQPGQAPELSVIVDYDINDYRTKTELTSEKMRSCITTALRSYRDINSISELAASREQLQNQVSKRNNELEKVNHQLIHEIEERRVTEGLLETTNDKLESIINNSTTLISLKDIDGRYDLVNTMFKSNLNISDENIVGKTDYDIFPEEIASAICMNDEKVLKSGEAIQCEEILPSSDGEHFYLCVKFPLYTKQGDIYRICSIDTDITDRLEVQNKLLHMSQYDTLTGLPNRCLFLDRFTQAITRNQSNKHHIAVMFIDLDRFKLINETLGHNIGDQLLVKVAERLSSLVKDEDSVCRIGGDEFVVLLTEICHEGDIVRMAEKIMVSLAETYLIDQKELIITVSIGISRSPLDSDDVQVLLKKADLAMYKAKKLGRNCYSFYMKSDDARASDRLSLEVDMRKMLTEEKSQLFLLYQPKVNPSNGDYSSVEALVRWQHPERGIISPMQFIPLLEETGLIVIVGEWVLREACEFAVRNAKKGHVIKVAVNLSPLQLAQKEKKIITTIKAILTETECKPEWIELEVTESSLLSEIEYTKSILDEIAEMGINLAIDDFGTGYSSMNYLKNLPFNTLKIDRSFICNTPNSEQDRAIVTTIAHLAANLGLNVVAEGVETVEQFNLVKSVLIESSQNQIQGFLFSEPVREEGLSKRAQEITKTWLSIEITNQRY